MTDGALTRQHRFTVLPEHLIRDRRVSDRAMRLWCLLDRYAGANGQAFPSRARLCRDLGDISMSSLDRAITDLVKAGWLAKERREKGGVNDYTVLVVPAEEVPEEALLDLSSHMTTPPPVVTGDVTHASHVTTPLVTDDEEKEASPKDHQGSETGPDSLRSSAVEELTEQERRTGRDADGQPLRGKRLDLLTNEVTKAWWDWAKTEGILPTQSFIACRGVVKTALANEIANGRTPDSVKHALARLAREHRPVSGGAMQIALGLVEGQGSQGRQPYHPSVDAEYRERVGGYF